MDFPLWKSGRFMLHHHFMHVDNELVEFMPVGEQESEEIIEEYEEEIPI